MRRCCYFLACMLLTPPVIAEDASSHHVYAKPVVRTAPNYPARELSRGHQGWVDLSYVVTEEGRVIDPVVEASSGSSAFERAAIATVRNWRYEPALRNGQPVQQCKTAARITFGIDGKQQGVSRRFHKRYKTIDQAIDDGNIDFATAELEELFEAHGLTLGELSWAWTLQARIAGVTGDTDLQLLAVQRALAVSKKSIPRSLRSGLLTTRVVLEMQKGNYARALDAYTALQRMTDAETPELDAAVRDIEKLVESDKLLVSTAEIGKASCETCDSSWKHRPLRRAIEIADIDGELGDLEIRCDWQRYVDQAREGVAWQIPASWGKCSVVVHGRTGSTFTLVELPSS